MTRPSTQSRKATAKAAQASAAQASDALAGIPPNLGDDTDPNAAAPEEFRGTLERSEKPIMPNVHANSPEAAVRMQPRFWIILEENEDIPPGGQFVSVDGMPFQIMPGQEVCVPRGVLEVLDHAIKSVAITDPLSGKVIGWRNQKRFPYTVIRDKPIPDEFVAK